MMSTTIHSVACATAHEYEAGEFTGPFSEVLIETGDGSRVHMILPAGTASAVAACINVAVASAAQAENAKTIAALKAKWNGICEAMNRGSWHGSEADALDQIESIKAEIAKLEAAQ